MAAPSTPADQCSVSVMLPGAKTFTQLHPITYNARVGSNVDSTSFVSIPPEKRFLCATKVRVHGQDLPFDRLKTWSLDWSTRSAVVLNVTAVPSNYTPVPDESLPVPASHPPVRREDLRPCFAIKLANHVHDSGPYGQGDLWHEILEREALFYQRRLRQLQGVAVPTHYGMWTGTAPWGGTIACSIMEWCGEQYMEDANDRRLYSIERRCGTLVSSPSDFLFYADGNQSEGRQCCTCIAHNRLPAWRFFRRGLRAAPAIPSLPVR